MQVTVNLAAPFGLIVRVMVPSFCRITLETISVLPVGFMLRSYLLGNRRRYSTLS